MEMPPIIWVIPTKDFENKALLILQSSTGRNRNPACFPVLGHKLTKKAFHWHELLGFLFSDVVSLHFIFGRASLPKASRV